MRAAGFAKFSLGAGRLAAAAAVTGILLALISCATDTLRSGNFSCSDGDTIVRRDSLPIDGADLYLLVRGRCDAPLLLWLHGGPGGAERPLFRLYNRALEERFMVAYWDQRGAGRSFDPDADATQLTVARHLDDLDHVVDHLHTELNKEKIVLVGHSWGSALGLIYARDHPQKIAAFIGVAQFVSGLDSQRAQYSFIEAEARKHDDREALDRLAELDYPPYSDDEVLRSQRLVDRFGGYFHKRPSFFLATLSGIFRGYVTPWEIGTFIRANDISVKAMNSELTALDLRRSVPAAGVPVIFMLGRHDQQLDSRIAENYFKQLRAPRKKLVWFEHSAHNIPFEEPEEFNKIVVDELTALGIR